MYIATQSLSTNWANGGDYSKGGFFINPKKNEPSSDFAPDKNSLDILTETAIDGTESETKYQNKANPAIILIFNIAAFIATTGFSDSTKFLPDVKSEQPAGSYEDLDVNFVKKLTNRLLAEKSILKIKEIHLSEPLEKLAEETIHLLAEKNIVPDYINPSNEGGIMVEFTRKGIYNQIEIYGDNEVVFLTEDDKEVLAWNLNTENFLSFIDDKIIA